MRSTTFEVIYAYVKNFPTFLLSLPPIVLISKKKQRPAQLLRSLVRNGVATLPHTRNLNKSNATRYGTINTTWIPYHLSTHHNFSRQRVMIFIVP